MTKYILKGRDIYLHKRTRKDESWNQYQDTRIGNVKDVVPLFRHPITAIAYSFDLMYNDTIMHGGAETVVWDKKDIIKAVDFWISDKILENERLLFLNDKLDDVEEIELKNLIRLRNEVKALPTDAKFTRNGYNPNISTLKYYKTWLVEFFYCKEKTISKMVNKTKETFDMSGVLQHLADSINRVNHAVEDNISARWYAPAHAGRDDEVSGLIGGGRHSGYSTGFRDDGRRYDFNIGGTSNNRSPTDITNPDNWIITQVNGTSGNRFYRVTGPGGRPVIRSFQRLQEAQNHITRSREENNSRPVRHGRTRTWRTSFNTNDRNSDPHNWEVALGFLGDGFRVQNRANFRTIATGFRTVEEAQRYITHHRDIWDQQQNRDRVTDMTPPIITTAPRSRTGGVLISNSNSGPVMLVGEAGEDIISGDLIYRNEDNRRWYVRNDSSSDATHICVGNCRRGEMVSALREGVFTYPHSDMPIPLRPGDSHVEDPRFVGRVTVRRVDHRNRNNNAISNT